MKTYKIIWLLLTSASFRYWFEKVLLYALINFMDKRGTGASDVLHFHHYWRELIFTKQQIVKIEQEIIYEKSIK